MEKQGTGSMRRLLNIRPGVAMRATNGQDGTTNGREGTTNGHEWTRVGRMKPRKARKIQGGGVEPRMNTKGHERTRMDRMEPRTGGREPRKVRKARKGEALRHVARIPRLRPRQRRRRCQGRAADGHGHYPRLDGHSGGLPHPLPQGAG